jgi:hypothetical protein
MALFFKLIPRHTKSVTEVEVWGDGICRIERYIGWRYGAVLVDGKSDLSFINNRTANMLLDICLTDHLVILDQRLQVSFCEDLIFDENLSKSQKKKIEDLYSKVGENAFFEAGWEILETKLYFMGEIEVIPTNKKEI